MAAIGGVFNMDGGGCQVDSLMRMSRAMLRRGGDTREAAVFEGGGLLWSDSREAGVVAERGDRLLICDGRIFCGGDGAGADFFGESDASLFLDILGSPGAPVFEGLSGEYSVAMYDKRKKELTLLRDGRGGRPLYYLRRGSSLCFASEIKGVSAFLDSPLTVKRDRLGEHILSRGGQYRGVELFCDMSEVRAGGGCVVSRLGIAPFEYRACQNSFEQKEESGRFSEGLACPEGEKLFRMLCEILYAFDYPQFDCLMPSFLRDTARAKECGGVVVDGSLCCDIEYSVERRDRLSTLAGYRPRTVPPKTYTVKDRELKRLERTVSELFTETDRKALEYIIGRNIEDDIRREGNAARRIRYMGMAVQTVIWYERRGICLV